MPSDWQHTLKPETWLHSVLSSPDEPPAAELAHHESINVRQPAAGVLEITPASITRQSIVISCGVHGNETAPIELVGALTEDILSGALSVKSRILIVVGHPRAIIAGKRFIDTNLNRLFGSPSAEKSGYEGRRAEELKAVVSDFFSTSEVARYHLDLHTAIRPSLFEKFAISPFAQTLGEKELSLLANLGIEAVVESHQPAGTFSYFSANQAQAKAFTLELGKVAPFGKNDLTKLEGLKATIGAMIEDQPIKPIADLPILFKVVKELLRTSEDFQLLVDNETPNFTAYRVNTLIAQGEDSQYRTQNTDERIVFPNPNVPVGQRVGLMIVSKMKVSPFFYAK